MIFISTLPLNLASLVVWFNLERKCQADDDSNPVNLLLQNESSKITVILRSKLVRKASGLPGYVLCGKSAHDASLILLIFMFSRTLK